MTSGSQHHRERRKRDRWSVPRGRIILRELRGSPGQEYLLYVPNVSVADPSMLVSVHGISRNAEQQAKAFSAICEAEGAVLLLPIFTRERHRAYQRLGRTGQDSRVDLLLHALLAEASAVSGSDACRFRLFGYSAGAQFAHRYVMAHPDRVERAVIAAAGWYTFPDHTDRFPYGIRPSNKLKGVSLNPEKFLRVPIQVLVGADDKGGSNLRRTKRVDGQQGATRVERARRWTDAMRSAAAAYGLAPRVELAEVPGIDHSFKAFCEAGSLIERVHSYLYMSDSSSTNSTPGEVPKRLELMH